MSRQGFGVWLRDQRLARGWGKAEMARYLHAAMSARKSKVPGVKSITSSVGGWEGGGRYPRDLWRAVICQVLGIAFEDFPSPSGSSAPPAVTAALDVDDPRPWMRVAGTLLTRIGTGELKPGDRMPRAADFGRAAGVSVPTVRLAYAYLEGRGVIRYRPGTGFHVSSGQPDATRQDDVPGKAAIGEDCSRRLISSRDLELVRTGAR